MDVIGVWRAISLLVTFFIQKTQTPTWHLGFQGGLYFYSWFQFIAGCIRDSNDMVEGPCKGKTVEVTCAESRQRSQEARREMNTSGSGPPGQALLFPNSLLRGWIHPWVPQPMIQQELPLWTHETQGGHRSPNPNGFSREIH